MKKFPFLSALLLFLSFPALAQQTWTNGYFPFNRFIYNPAFTALNEKAQVDAQLGSVQAPIPGYYKQAQVNAQFHIPATHSGIGVNVFNEVAGEGNTNRSNYNVSYAYKHFVGKNQKYQMSYGVNAGFISLSADYLGINNRIHINYGSMGIGATFSTVDNKLYVGLGSSNLLFFQGVRATYNIKPYSDLNLNAGYRFDIHQFSIQPNLLVSVNNTQKYVSLSTQFQYKWLNIGLGKSYDVNASELFASIQATFKKNWTVGYVFMRRNPGLISSYSLHTYPQMLCLTYRRK